MRRTRQAASQPRQACRFRSRSRRCSPACPHLAHAPTWGSRSRARRREHQDGAPFAAPRRSLAQGTTQPHAPLRPPCVAHKQVSVPRPLEEVQRPTLSNTSLGYFTSSRHAIKYSTWLLHFQPRAKGDLSTARGLRFCSLIISPTCTKHRWRRVSTGLMEHRPGHVTETRLSKSSHRGGVDGRASIRVAQLRPHPPARRHEKVEPLHAADKRREKM